MRKLFILLLLIPLVSAHHPVFDETGFVESELPVVYSNKFSLSEVDITLEDNAYFNLEIINEGPESLFLIINYPDFLSGEKQVEIRDTYNLEVKVDNSRNSYGLIEFQAPESSLFLPVTQLLADNAGFDSFEIRMKSDVYFAGKDASVNVKITEDNSEITKQTELIFTLFSKDNQKVLESIKTIKVDALFDEEVSLYLPEYLAKGDYMLFVEARYADRSDYDSSFFSLDEKKSFSYWIYALFIVIIGLFIFLIHNSHKHLSNLKKIHTKHSLSIKKHHASRAKVELVEKKLSSIRSAYLEGAISKKNYDITVKKLREKIKQLIDSVKRGPK
jgi:hypothetical protein